MADPPLRQLTRLRTEMSMVVLELTNAMFPERPLIGAEFGFVARVCLPDWTSGTALARPDAPRRAITIRKMALSLGFPAESVRRQVKLLLDRGNLAISAQGVSLAVTPENEPFVMRYYRGVHDALIRLLEDVASTCDLGVTLGAAPAFGAADVIERALDTLLLPIDTFRPVNVARGAFVLWAALTAVAVRGVTYDPVLSRRHANEIPPDHLRSGISLRRLAVALAVPYTTAWRNIQALHDAGLVTRLDNDRWTVLTCNLMAVSVRDIGASPSILVYNKVRELAVLGFDPACAAQFYQEGRPPLADLGLA